MDDGNIRIVFTRNRFLFPRCSFEIPAKLDKKGELEPGQQVLAYPVKGFFSLFGMKGEIATLAEVTRIIDNPGIRMAELRGVRRVMISSVRRFETAAYDELFYEICEAHEDVVDRLRKKAQQFVFLINIPESDRLIYLMNFLNDISDTTDFISHYFVVESKKKAKLYRMIDPCGRARFLEKYLDEMIAKLPGESRQG